jgi:hypothetical protein
MTSGDQTLLAVEESQEGGHEQFRLRGVIVPHELPSCWVDYSDALARAKAA